MLETGYVFLYGENGICRVEGTRKQMFRGEEREYYILKPLYNGGSTIFVPVDSDLLKQRMKELLSKEDILLLKKGVPSDKTYWIDDDTERLDHFNNVILNCDRKELIRLLKSIHSHKEDLKSDGKHLRTSDEKVMKRAEKILGEEIATVMGVSPEEAIGFIFE